jgi:hypothetical protein
MWRPGWPAGTGAVTLMQRLGSALNLNIHVHMLLLDGVYVDHPNVAARFRWSEAPTSQELTKLAHTIARRVGRFLQRQGLLERDMENSYCGAALKVIACIVDPALIKQILDHLGQKAETSESSVLAESRAPPVGLTHGLFD